MKLKLTLAALAALATTALAPVAAQAQPALEEIKVSYQPALYWALPFFVASEKNWWAEVGLKPVFSTFPAGVPQRRTDWHRCCQNSQLEVPFLRTTQRARGAPLPLCGDSSPPAKQERGYMIDASTSNNSNNTQNTHNDTQLHQMHVPSHVPPLFPLLGAAPPVSHSADAPAADSATAQLRTRSRAAAAGAAQIGPEWRQLVSMHASP